MQPFSIFRWPTALATDTILGSPVDESMTMQRFQSVSSTFRHLRPPQDRPKCCVSAYVSCAFTLLHSLNPVTYIRMLPAHLSSCSCGTKLRFRDRCYPSNYARCLQSRRIDSPHEPLTLWAPLPYCPSIQLQCTLSDTAEGTLDSPSISLLRPWITLVTCFSFTFHD
jgi:hypothetical protein